VGNDSEPQADLRREWREFGNAEDHPVTLCVVITRGGVLPLSLYILSKGKEFSIERFGFSYRPRPFQPRAEK
jgi:hypothetical protein